ncbi:hypothetical protein VTJ83DRAFT_28 [Remersonia thermophila]|uniref:Fe2OG dioxygenase domain-containing protein n=1 Tax=Remersonia thermophila TaxID=72144 RepID=A0ABR4DK40_9PEZI
MPSLASLTLAALGGLAATPQIVAAKQTVLKTDEYVCEHPPYKPRIVSHSPLVIYLENFITPFERAYLLDLGKSTFAPSGITNRASNDASAIRTSRSTNLAPSDPVVSCIETRALRFQGLPAAARGRIEPLQLVKYEPTQHFHFHTDWFTSPSDAGPEVGGNRATSFFAYVKVEEGTTGGGTNFPRLTLEAGAEEEWCDEGWVDCDAPREEGVTFRPVEGNAVFWVNLLDGQAGSTRRGDERTLHAGLPVVTGGKVGMNIWTREGSVGEEIRGGVA